MDICEFQVTEFQLQWLLRDMFYWLNIVSADETLQEFP